MNVEVDDGTIPESDNLSHRFEDVDELVLTHIVGNISH